MGRFALEKKNGAEGISGVLTCQKLYGINSQIKKRKRYKGPVTSQVVARCIAETSGFGEVEIDTFQDRSKDE